ncbi:MAG TPA: hypothetical protein VIO33_01030 [Burkholderiaceae bacterium]
MNHRPSSVVAALLATLLGACASAPPPSGASVTGRPADASAASCAQLDAQIVQAAEARRAAEEKGQNAWKAVVPFAVAARYASGRAAAGEAEDAMAGLREQARRQGCASPSG